MSIEIIEPTNGKLKAALGDHPLTDEQRRGLLAIEQQAVALERRIAHHAVQASALRAALRDHDAAADKLASERNALGNQQLEQLRIAAAQLGVSLDGAWQFSPEKIAFIRTPAA